MVLNPYDIRAMRLLSSLSYFFYAIMLIGDENMETIVLDDRFDKLEKIFKENIKEVEKADYNKLLEICKKENIDVSENMTEEKIRKLLIDLYKEEIED